MPRTEKGSVSTSKDTTITQQSNWVCKLCKEAFTDDKAEVLECEVCEQHTCRKCLKLSSVEYKFMSKRQDIHWYCPPCEEKTLKNLKIEKEVQERCKEYYEKLEGRITNIEKKLEEKADKSDVVKIIKENEKRQRNPTRTKVPQWKCSSQS